MISSNSNNLPGPQSAFQPPTYIYQLSCKSMSIYGDRLREKPKDTWAKDFQKPFQDIVVSKQEDKALPIKKVTKMRSQDKKDPAEKRSMWRVQYKVKNEQEEEEMQMRLFEESQ